MIEIDRMSLEHVVAVHQIEVASYPTPWTLGLFLEELTKPESDWYVAVDEGEVVGYVGIQQLDGVAHLLNIAVREDRRREGIGKALLERALIRAGSRGVSEVTLEVRPANREAQHLYEDFGFVTVGRRRGYYADTGEDALLMTMRLAPRAGRRSAEAEAADG